MREAEVGDGQRRPDRPRAGDAPLHPRRRRPARRWRVRRRVGGRADGAQPRHRGPGARPAVEDALGRPAAAGRAGPDPVLRRRHAAARRAHQPPRRRLHRLAARVPQVAPGRPGRDQPRHRPAGDHRQPGAAPGREPRGDRRLQHGLDGVPHPARDGREAPQARADERREQGQDADRPGQPDAGEGHQGAGGPVDAEARREAARRGRGRAHARTASPGSSSPLRRPAGRRPSPRPSFRSRTARSRCSPTSTSRSTAARGSWCSA